MSTPSEDSGVLPVAQDLSRALADAHAVIERYQQVPTKVFICGLTRGLDVQGFLKFLKKELGGDFYDYPALAKMSRDHGKFAEVLRSYCEKNVAKPEPKVLPSGYGALTLNVDPTTVSKDYDFYMTTADEKLSPVSAKVWMGLQGRKADEAALQEARLAVKQYRPRGSRGVFKVNGPDGKPQLVFNTYVPAPWTEYEGEVPDELPPLFVSLVEHLLPLKTERRYLYAWIHTMLTDRAFVYLVLNGRPGCGKNTLITIIKALNGQPNFTAGKRSTFTEKFNTQLFNATCVWFDEVKYDVHMENAMKAAQATHLSEEGKGKDASRATRMYASMGISNNHIRDNYIAFDARKFVPLVCNTNDLRTSMHFKLIDRLMSYVDDEESKSYNVRFIAQIGRWILKHGASEEWDKLSYKGPAFYRLAHATAFVWQKQMLEVLMNPEHEAAIGFDKDGRVSFNKFKIAYKKLAKKLFGAAEGKLPDAILVNDFLRYVVDFNGKKIFITRAVDRSMTGDFTVQLAMPRDEIFLMTTDDLAKEDTTKIKEPEKHLTQFDPEDEDIF